MKKAAVFVLVWLAVIGALAGFIYVLMNFPDATGTVMISLLGLAATALIAWAIIGTVRGEF